MATRYKLGIERAITDSRCPSGCHSGCLFRLRIPLRVPSTCHSGCLFRLRMPLRMPSGCQSGCWLRLKCHKMPLMMLVQTQDAPHGAPRDATHDASRCASVCDSQRFLQTCLGCDPWCSMRLRILLGCVSKCACGLLFCANCMQALSDHGRQAACDATANSVLLLLVPWVQAHQTPPSDARPHCKHLDTHGNHRSAWRQTWLAGANLRKVKLRETGALCSSKPKEREESNRPRAT